MKISKYAEAAEFLNSFINYERLAGDQFRYDTKSFDLTHFRELLTAIGDPHLRYPVIHVAGTKGKGSTCTFVHDIYSAAGLRCGLYTSPHISSYCERIVVNGRAVPEQKFCVLLSRLADVSADILANSGNFRTVFEFLTASAFLYFAEEQVDIAIIETGLGGRLDSTNVFDSPRQHLVDVITSIGLDHTHILGGTIEQIAGEKAGIIRPHATVVVGPQREAWAGDVRRIIHNRMQEVGAERLVDAEAMTAADAADAPHGNAVFKLVSETTSELGAALCAGLRLHPGMPGHHQVNNLRTVLCALLAMDDVGGPSVGAVHVISAVQATHCPGRFEIISHHPPVVVDGAHCALSASALGETFAALFGSAPVVLVTGFMRDKAAVDVCTALDAKIKAIAAVCCAPPTPRALPPAQAAEAVHSALRVPVYVASGIQEAITQAIAIAGGNAGIVVFGSMYLIGAAEEILSRQFRNRS